MKNLSFRKGFYGTAAFLLSGMLVFSAVLPVWNNAGTADAVSEASDEPIHKLDGSIRTNIEDYYEPSVVQKLPESVSGDQTLSVLVRMDTETMIEAYDRKDTDVAIGEFAASEEGRAVSSRIEREGRALQTRLKNAGVQFELGNSYDTIWSGFEIVVKASEFNKVCNALSGKAQVVVGEVYNECETQVVENKVNVYETGIFNSADSGFDGSGTVIAVLDTGLDYTHSAFDAKNFTGREVIDLSVLSQKISRLGASREYPGLTAANVYYSPKVPYTFDYADHDPDVYPINSEHGTHVAGVMVGKDSRITGVAPNAQLAVMKVFSEKEGGAKTAWLLAALEDCVILGVDVINMSLGSSCGFSREVDKVARQEIYDSIYEQGISLVCAASNDYNSTFGSEKNGNLGLTSNPDTATVGSPSTYQAALSVASISGVKTPYLTYNGEIIYFIEASDRAGEPKDFVDDILGDGETQQEFEYITIPGIGRETDYLGIEEDVKGRIALVKRGQTNFEEKARIAMQKGAVGCIIFNNVSGDITMTVGNIGNYPVCSLSKDDGELLASAAGGRGKIIVSRNQIAGPFMSSFSSWGPTPDLKIKPEITAHGGEILSAVPGQSYDRLSGTSMASPNQAGVTALVRQYVKQIFPKATPKEVTATVNQLMMSTADIALNTNGLPFAVRKQGSGLANLYEATHTPAYIRTYDCTTDEIMDKAKLELGDDPEKKGEYTMKFEIVNLKKDRLVYDLSADVMTEGVSEQLTARGDHTVTEKGYRLDHATVEAVSVIGGARNADGNSITVYGESTAIVTVKITLGNEDKAYLDTNFENGMYVEGFLKLAAKDGTEIGLNVPYLAFYGDWSVAPIFDLDYFATNKDELDDAIDIDQKTLPDAYATRPVGGLYDDYITYLGSFSFLQDPSSTTKISADRKYIALTNQSGEDGGVNSINGVWCGLLRGVKKMLITIEDATTGEVIYEQVKYNQYKSFNSGGSIIPSNVDIDFNVADYNLKNNTEYIVTLKGFLDYENDGSETNLNNTFQFPFVTDFEAPIITDVEYTYEYDTELKKNRLYANVSVFDNHYVQGIMPGYATLNAPGDQYRYTLHTFSRYITPVVGERNTTNVITIELTDYVDEILSSYNGNSIVIQVMDYASNFGIYEIEIPDEIQMIEFTENETGGIRISPNQTYPLAPNVFPKQDTSWVETVNYESSDPSIARIVNGKLIGVKSGSVTLTATSNSDSRVRATVDVTVLSPGEEGYVAYDKPVAESFRLTGYDVNKVFYFVSSEDRDLGATEAGTNVQFSAAQRSYSLRMFPSESITLNYELVGYFPESEYRVEFSSSNPDIVEVTPEGRITAMNVERLADGTVNPLNQERTALISVSVLMKDANGQFRTTTYSQTVSITVKEAYTTSGFMLTSYKGLGGKVVVPADFGVTEIAQYAFSNYQYVPKDLANGDVIDEEDPYASKIWYIGENTIEEIVLPEGVETISSYAFANLTELRKIVFPSTLKKIQTGAFYNCVKLDTIEFSGKNNLQFVNQSAFENCRALGNFGFNSIVALGNRAFANSNLGNFTLPASAQSIGAEAFLGNTRLSEVRIEANLVKLGANAFANCSNLRRMYVNAAVVPAGLFDGCTRLASVTLGPDVSVLGQNAFRGTMITSISVAEGNNTFDSHEDGGYLIERETGKLVFVSPSIENFSYDNGNIKTIGTGAFSNASKLRTVSLPNVTVVEDYGFAGCESLSGVQLGTLTEIGDYAFYNSGISRLPDIATGATVGDYAFAGTHLVTATLPANLQTGEYAFANCTMLTSLTVGDNVSIGANAFRSARALSSVTIGDNVSIGDSAFRADDMVTIFGTMQYNSSVGCYYDPYISSLSRLTIGENATIGNYAFYGAGSYRYSSSLGGYLRDVELGAGATIGDYAFYGCVYLETIDLSGVKSIGSYAFSGTLPLFMIYEDNIPELVSIIAYAPVFTRADLSSAESLGEGAFAYALDLGEVVLGDAITEIKAYTFETCASLTSVNLENVAVFGVGAFSGCSSLTSVEIAPLAVIGSNAFAGCTALEEAANLDQATTIGDSAFEATALTKADLSAATYLGDFAFAFSNVGSVVFGDGLYYVGDNPFADCPIGEFTENGEKTFAIGDAGVLVIDGVLYRNSELGMQLITYPLLKKDSSFTVADGTVRIGDLAFYNSGLRSVELAIDTGAIGDKAFYGCNDLTMVVFQSIEAPILEEAYDEDYAYGTNSAGVPGYMLYAIGRYTINYTNGRTEDVGLELVPYLMWSADPTNLLYGANFIARIGDSALEDHFLVMVRPVNGTGYESFIYSKYFDASAKGAAAPEERTREIVRRIEALPEIITLDNEEEVNALLAMYQSITAEQQGLVTNYNKLTAAQGTIEYLKSSGTPSTDPSTPEDPGVKPTQTNEVAKWVGSGIGIAAALIVIVLAAVLLLKKKKSDGPSGEDGTAETEETSDKTQESEDASDTAQEGDETSQETEESEPAEPSAEDSDGTEDR